MSDIYSGLVVLFILTILVSLILIAGLGPILLMIHSIFN